MDEVRRAELWADRWGCGVALGEQKGGAHKLTPGAGNGAGGARVGTEGSETALSRCLGPGGWIPGDSPGQDPDRTVCHDPKRVPCDPIAAATSVSGIVLASLPCPSPISPERGQRITIHFTGCALEQGCLGSGLSPWFPGNACPSLR